MWVGGQSEDPAVLPPGKTGTHRIGGWVRPGASLDMCGKSRLHWVSITGPSSTYRAAVPTELSRLARTFWESLSMVKIHTYLTKINLSAPEFDI
jgi:hypothetical protein